jgi:uncharacterized protein (DUF1800 family)
MDPRTRLAHLLRRAGFGPAPGELDERLGHGYEATVRSLVEPGPVQDGLADIDRQIGGILDFNVIDDVRAWWIYRMIHSQRPLVEKMTLFWHGHFATAVSKVGNPYLMYQQNQLFRDRGLGSFAELLLRVSQDPAMLIWLDGAANKKAHPNENYAREIMELFTTGPGVYSEKDVQEAARAFTGWHLRDETFFFNEKEHDFGDKLFLGKKGPFDGADIVRILSEHPQTAQRLVRRLFAFFVYEDPEPGDLAPFVRTFRDTHGDVREVLRAIFLSPVFSSERAYRANIKSPAEFVIGAIRGLGGTITPRQVSSLMARMGQDLFNPPSVKGWDGGAAWISTSTLFERFNFAASITTSRGPKGTSHVDPETLFAGVTPTSAAQALGRATDQLLDGELPEPTRQAMINYLLTPDAPQKPVPLPGDRTVAFGPPPRPVDGPPFVLDRHTMDEKVRGVLHLLMSTPEFQLN